MNMTDTPSQLPNGFADLEAFCPEWCPTTERDRAFKRATTPMEVLRTFHAETSPRLEAVIDYLNGFPNDPAVLPPDAKRLFQLAQMVMEAAVPIDLQWEISETEDVFPLERLTFTPGAPSRAQR